MDCRRLESVVGPQASQACRVRGERGVDWPVLMKCWASGMAVPGGRLGHVAASIAGIMMQGRLEA